MTWPPIDTDRNRFTYRVSVAAGVLATVYCLLFALQSGGVFPWAFFTLCLAGTLLAGLGLLLMREQRQAAAKAEKAVSAGPPGTAHPGDADSSSGGRAVGE